MSFVYYKKKNFALSSRCTTRQKLYIAYPLPFIQIYVHADRNKNHDLPKCLFFKSVTGWLIFLDAIFN